MTLKVQLKKLFSKKSAVGPVISTTMLAGAVIALSFVVFTWTYNRSLVFNIEYENLVESTLERIKETVVFEFVYYNTSVNELSIYLMNCGKIDNVSVTSVFLSNSTWHQSFTNLNLTFLNGTLTQSLNVDYEGYLRINADLLSQRSYSIRIITGRGRGFETTFVA